METISKKAVSIYRYHLSWLRGVSKLVFTVFYLAYVAGLFVAGAYVGKLANEGEIPVGIFLFGGVIMLHTLYRFCHDLLGTLRSATIVVDDEGVSTRIAGVKVRRMAWVDIKKIVKLRSASRFSGYVNSIEFVSKKQIGPKWLFLNLLGNIVFSQSIRDHKELVAKINSYAQKNDIPLYFSNVEAAKNMEAPFKGEDGTPGRQWLLRPPEILMTHL